MTSTTDTPTVATPTERADALLARMTLDEKLAQLVGYWVTVGDQAVAPLQENAPRPAPLREFAAHGLGQLTRVYGTTPVDAASRRAWLAETQQWLRTSTRLGIPALVHEECLTGLTTWRATSFPTPLAWGAAFDPDLVESMGAAIGTSMRSLSVHQGLAPVLDVVRDVRWGRVEECIGEDPWLVGEVGAAYVRGLEGTGVVATLKHFVGYSASHAGRNLAPSHVGPRELADVLLVPFEMALLDGGARSVMHSYSDVDGVPPAADPALLTELLRDRWGFEGTVVSDYYGVAFLQDLHHVAASSLDAAHQALTAGVDVELPTGDAYGLLADAVRAGVVDERLVDRAARRVLAQKAALGLLDDEPAADDVPDGPVDLDPAAHRAIAWRLAAESVVLLANDGTLPLATGAPEPAPGDGTQARTAAHRVAVVGPNADRARALFGCYAFPNHVLDQHPDVELGIEAPTVLDALRSALPASVVTHDEGCAVTGDDRAGFAAAVASAEAADVVVAVLGDQAGLFGRGTSGEGCDAADLELPGAQRALLEALLATGRPVVAVLLTGRPYAVGWALERCAAVVQAFFPGEAGATAVADVLTGAVNPSGRLPVSLPAAASSQPATYRHPALGGSVPVSSVDPTPARPFGFGLSYTSFAHTGLVVAGDVATDGHLVASVVVTNTGDRAGDDVVQLYAHDEVASTAPPVAQLLAFRRVALEPGERVRVTFTVPTRRLASTGRDLVTAVEPGDVTLWVGASCADAETTARVRLVGPRHAVSVHDPRTVAVALEPA